jgi:TonB family protein
MKTKLLFLALGIGAAANAQTKKVEHYNKSLGISEVYTVSDVDANLREGAFKQPHKYGVSTEGYYHNNVQDSVWKYYYREALVAEGQYKAGKKAGVWTGYSRGFARLKYDFTKQELLQYTPASLDSILKFKAITPSADTIFDRSPVYINGIGAFIMTLIEKMHYPAIAREGNKQGEVIIAFTIDEEGNTGNFAIKKKLGYGLEDEALRVMQQNDGAWVPAVLKGKRVAVQCEVPIWFEIVKPGEKSVHGPHQIIISAS